MTPAVDILTCVIYELNIHAVVTHEQGLNAPELIPINTLVCATKANRPPLSETVLTGTHIL